MSTSARLRPALALLATALLGSARDDRPAPAGDGRKPIPSREALLADLHRGVVLSLHSREKGHDYGPALAEIAGLGASWVSLSLAALFPSVRATTIDRSSTRTPCDEDLVATIRKAKARSLRVLLFPVVLIRDPGPDDWRGNLDPTDVGEWFKNYRDFVLHYARIARDEGVEAFSVGSEYCKQERRTKEWREIVRAVREVYPGLLTYSANWDHYDVPEFWDDLDFVGMSSYHRLSYSKDPKPEELVASWEKKRAEILDFARKSGKKVAFTEVGYPSLDDGNEYPWNYLMKNPVDLAEQADCYRAFANVWPRQPWLQGVFFYEWWGEGGKEDPGYTPRGKPAEAVLRDYLKSLAPVEEGIAR